MKYIVPYGKPEEVVYGDQPYINGDPSIGRQGSIPPAGSIEYPQREIVNIIRAAFGAGNETNSDLRQLAKAIMSGRLNFSIDTGIANQYTGTLPIAPDQYYDGMTVRIRIINDNAGASTLSLNGLAAKPIKRPDGTDLQNQDLRVGMIATFSYSAILDVWILSGSQTGVGVIYLTAPRTYYVNWATGNDTYDGLQATVGATPNGPFKTLQRAADAMARFNLNGFNVTVNVADSASYTSAILPDVAGQGLINWVGNAATPANVVINSPNGSTPSIIARGTHHNMSGFKVTGAGEGFVTNLGAILGLSNIEYGATVGAQNRCVNGGQIRLGNGVWRITGGSAFNSFSPSSFVSCEQGGRFDISNISSPPSLTIVGTPNYVSPFLFAADLGVVVFRYTSLTGAATGTRYQALTNSVINTGGGGATYVPGNVAGSVSSGGQYI